jgi:hypothetical protein
MRSEGKVGQGAYYKSDVHTEGGGTMAEFKPLNTEMANANAERFVALWNASEGMTTEQAVMGIERFKAYIADTGGE